MFDLTHEFWYWAFRYKDTDEPAILVAMLEPQLRAPVTQLIREHELVDTSRLIYTNMIAPTEWKTWHAFNLCPTIEVYVKDPDMRIKDPEADVELAYREIPS